jgi:Transglycosylase-like domain
LKAPLIAVISVGIAAATPAVAISAKEPSSAESRAPAPNAVTDSHQPFGATPITDTAYAEDQRKKQRLLKRYVRLRNRLNRLIAKREGRRKPKSIRHISAAKAQWPDRKLLKATRTLRKRIRRVRSHIRATAAVRGRLDRIAACESHGNPRAIGGGGIYRGKYQFSYGTWASVGGRGDPAAAPEHEQDRRAAILLARTGGSAWPVCG